MIPGICFKISQLRKVGEGGGVGNELGVVDQMPGAEEGWSREVLCGDHYAIFSTSISV